MIFATLGTHEQPFPRLLDLLEPLAAELELVVQHGHTPPRTDLWGRWIQFTGYDEVVELMRTADAVICHAGVGTILTALDVGKTPMAVPRMSRLGEHVDDHQLQIVEKFASLGYVVPCMPGNDLAAKIADARGASATGRAPIGDLKETIAAAARRPRRRRRLVSFAFARPG